MSKIHFSHPLVERANQEKLVTIKGKNTGKDYIMRYMTYGALSQDIYDPLSAVSVSNSSMSIDLWKGCQWQCAYCHVQGTYQDLDSETLTMPNKVQKRFDFDYQSVVDTLVNHPFFIPSKTIISIGTASTEPFAPHTRGQVLELMEYIASKKMNNPIWIVTKAGFPKGFGERLKDIISSGTPVVLSLCWANNPKNIEPVQNNRFQNIEEAYNAGALINWYMRPLAVDWSAQPEKLEESFRFASQYKEYLSAIVPGGLRWTEGIEYGLTEARSEPMPAIPKNDNIKDLPDSIWETIEQLSQRYMPNIPVMRKSSEMLSHLLAPYHITLSWSPLLNTPNEKQYEAAQKALERLSLNEIKIVTLENNNIQTEPPLSKLPYTIRQTALKGILQALWHNHDTK